MTTVRTVWLGTMGFGLLRLSPDDGSVKAYIMRNGAVHDKKMNSLTNDYISKLSLSPDGKRVYIATTMGLCCYDISADSWTSVFGVNRLMYGVPVRVVKEYDGRLWIGTNDGLYCYDLMARKMERLNSGGGLMDNGICSIEQDRRGRLWVSTDHGLCCHDLNTDRTDSYFIDNGLQSNEFSDGASFTSDNGMMLFRGVGGVTWFDPSTVNDSKWNATVKLTAFMLNGKPVNSHTESGGRKVCDTTAIAADRFSLSCRDNTFAIRLSTLTYDTPEHITYIYSINNEPEVRLRPGQNELTFSHLPPGTYHFRVKALRNNQQTAERAFAVVVRQPWWFSWWAYCFYAALVGLVVWQYLRNRSHREQSRLRLQEHIHAEEMGEAKLRFFINISHEIRTPMTLILTPLLSLMKHDTDPQRRGVYEVMRRNAERILSLINQIMDLRKIDKGRMMMRMQETDIVSFVADIHSLFAHQAKAKRIDLRFEHDAERLPVWIDRTNFDKVIVNIL